MEDLEAIAARERILEEWAKQGGQRDELLAAQSALEKVSRAVDNVFCTYKGNTYGIDYGRP